MAGFTGYRTQVKQIPDGNRGIFVSVDHLLSFIRQGRKDPRIRTFTARLVQGCRNKDYFCEARVVYEWIKGNIRFVRDPHNTELLQEAFITLTEGYGDCDDHVILLNSMLQTIGVPTRIVLVASRSAAPNIYNHIFTEALLPVKGKDTWVAMDTTPITQDGKMANFGYQPKGFTETRREVV